MYLSPSPDLYQQITLPFQGISAHPIYTATTDTTHEGKECRFYAM